MSAQFNNVRREAGIAFSYFVVSLLLLYPLLPHLLSQLAFASNGDIRLSLMVLFSNLKKVTQGDLLNLFQLPILFPLSHTMTAGLNLFGQTLLVLPLYLVHVRNVYAIYNFLTFFAYVAAGYCAYRFVGEWVEERWIAWVAGALYILLPFRVHNIPHLNLMFNFPIPLTLLFFFRFLKNGRNKDLVFLFLSLFSQFLFDLSLGLFLGIALGIFFLVHQVLFGLQPARSWLRLMAAALLFVLALALIFSPYLSPKTSFSDVDEVKSIPAAAFSTPLSFYSNWSYLLFFLKRIFWGQSPRSLGISLLVLFLLAFVPYLAGRLQKGIALACSFFLIAPALAVIVLYDRLPPPALDQACRWALLLFFLTFSSLLVLIWKKTPRGLLLLALSWMLLQFFSSQVSLPFFNLFQGLARLFPFLLRSRGIRTEYVLSLLFIAISAFGISYFFRRFRKKKALLALALLLVFAERIRWPVLAGKLEDYRPAYRAFYQSLASSPDHFGVLELPFYPVTHNHYPLFTLFHDRHTYHGHVYYLGDHLKLNGDSRLKAESGFSGMGDPGFTQMLKSRGIRIILLFKNAVYASSQEGSKAWYLLSKQIKKGKEAGLYEKVETTQSGIVLVLSEREQGASIRYFLPHFALRGKKRLVCTIAAHGETAAAFLFNGTPIKQEPLRAGTRTRVVIPLQGLSLAPQFNYLEIRSGPSLELLSVRTES